MADYTMLLDIDHVSMQKLFVEKTHIIICVLFITVMHFMTTIVHGLLIVVFRDRIYTNLQNW